MPIVDLPVSLVVGFGRRRSKKVVEASVRTSVPVDVPSILSEDAPLVAFFKSTDGDDFPIRLLADGRVCRPSEGVSDLAELAKLVDDPLAANDYPLAHPSASSHTRLDLRAPVLAAYLALDDGLMVVDPDVGFRMPVWSEVLSRSFVVVSDRVWQVLETIPAIAVHRDRKGDGVAVEIVIDVEASRRSMGPDRHHFNLADADDAFAFATSLGGGPAAWKGPWSLKIEEMEMLSGIGPSSGEHCLADVASRRRGLRQLLEMADDLRDAGSLDTGMHLHVRRIATGAEDMAASVSAVCRFGREPGAPEAILEFAAMWSDDAARIDGFDSVPSEDRDEDAEALASMPGI
jgi:hypothetical protein